jgi:hypothetical protein
MRSSDGGASGAGRRGDGASHVQFSLLGPVRAHRGPAELDAGPRQQRAILALLLARANQLVTVDAMIELLWDQDPPGSSVNIIHKYIGCIRRLLEPDLTARASGRWLTRHGEAYRLAADESTSDLIAFRRLVRDARSAHADGRPSAALDLATAREALERRLGLNRVAAEPAAVADIIELCGRLPLALAAVSARAAAHPDFTLASIAADLRRTQGRLDAFAAAGVAADARAVFSWLTGAVQLTKHRPGRYSLPDLIRAYATELSEARG